MNGAASDADLNARDGREWIRLAKRGDLEGAWRASDRILQRSKGVRHATVPRHFQRIWDGSDLTGRRVLVRCYHGLGDTIQFIRYAPLLRSISREVVVWAQAPLLPLLESVPGVDRCLPLHDGEPEVDYDVDIEVMELPYAFRTTLATIPREVPYLTAEPLPFADDGPRAGLVWRAGDWNERRSIEFSLVRTLFDDQRLSWYSLQLERGSQDCDPRLRSLDVRSVAATARAISAMNLVISVDTMPAHLAGALGMPVWTLLPHDADWRWMEDRSDSPWYPTMRLFRQPSPGDWHSVIQTVRRALTNLGPTAGLGMPSLL